MSKRIYTLGLSTTALIAALALASPANAQLGGVTGTVGGTVDSSVRTTTDISARTRSRAKVTTPRIEAPRSDVKVRANSPAKVTYGATRTGGYHSHGHYRHHTHTYGYDHFYDDHHHGHGSHTYIHGEFKSGDKDGDKTKDEKQAEVTVVYSKDDLLTYGTPVRSEIGVSMGVITSLQRMSDGEIVGVTVGETKNLISVGQLSVEGNVLIHSLPAVASTKTKGELAFEAEVEMVE